MPNKLTAQQAIDVAGDCVRQVTGSGRPLNLGEQLLLYGIFTQQQAAAVRHNVCANGVIGVQRFNFSLDPTFLITLSGSTTLGQLVNTIRQNSVPNQPGLAFGGQGASEPERFAVAARNFAEAAANFAEAAGTRRAPSKKSSKKGAKKSSKKGSKKSNK
jgi:hypothetical protein